MQELKATLFVDGFKFLEAPKWNGQLWLSDVFDDKVYVVSEVGDARVAFDVPNRPAGLGFMPNGDLIIASAKDKKLLRYDHHTVSEYADLSEFAPGFLNDFAIDSAGRIYVGDLGYDYHGGAEPRPTCLYRVDLDRSVTVAARDVEFPNGSVIIDGGRTLIVAETWVGRLTAFDLDAGGALSNRRVFADLGGRQPDGICADAEGAIWVGCYNTGEFVRVLEGGEVTHRVGLQGSGISCVLGGATGHRLFMTVFDGSGDDIAAGLRKSAVLAVDVDVPAPVPSVV